MKVLIPLSFLLTFLCLPQSQGLNDQHLGRWEGRNKGKIGFLILDEEGYATIQANGRTIGGGEFLAGNKAAYMTFEINYDTEPHEIDFVIQDIGDDSEIGRLAGIFEYLDKNTIRLALGFDGIRPEAFSGDKDIVFERAR